MGKGGKRGGLCEVRFSRTQGRGKHNEGKGCGEVETWEGGENVVGCGEVRFSRTR